MERAVNCLHPRRSGGKNTTSSHRKKEGEGGPKGEKRFRRTDEKAETEGRRKGRKVERESKGKIFVSWENFDEKNTQKNAGEENKKNFQQGPLKTRSKAKKSGLEAEGSSEQRERGASSRKPEGGREVRWGRG